MKTRKRCLGVSVRMTVISILILILGYSEYVFFVKGREFARPKHGTVISSYKSQGKYSSTEIATVLFANGDIQEVNTRHTLYRPGDNFTGQAEWSPIFGLTGVAYTWQPSPVYILLDVIAFAFNFCCTISFGLFIIIYTFGWFYKED